MHKMLRLFQATLLAGALAIAGTAFMPAASQANDPCDAKPSCDGGTYSCGAVYDPATGQFVLCTLSR